MKFLVLDENPRGRKHRRKARRVVKRKRVRKHKTFSGVTVMRHKRKVHRRKHRRSGFRRNPPAFVSRARSSLASQGKSLVNLGKELLEGAVGIIANDYIAPQVRQFVPASLQPYVKAALPILVVKFGPAVARPAAKVAAAKELAEWIKSFLPSAGPAASASAKLPGVSGIDQFKRAHNIGDTIGPSIAGPMPVFAQADTIGPPLMSN